MNIKNEEYANILNTNNGIIEFSSSGDSYGDENYYINFYYGDDNIVDIGDVVQELMRLKGLASGGENNGQINKKK